MTGCYSSALAAPCLSMQRTILDRKGKGTLSISLAIAFSRALSATVAFIIGLEKICLSRRGVLEMTFVCFNFGPVWLRVEVRKQKSEEVVIVSFGT